MGAAQSTGHDVERSTLVKDSSVHDRIVRVGLVPFSALTPMDAVNYVLESSSVRKPTAVRLSNAYCVAIASRDADYAKLLNGSGVNFPDGTPVVWAMKFRRSRTASLVRGPTLFRSVIDQGRESGLKSFFLGATEDTLARLVTELTLGSPGCEIVGTHSPPFVEPSSEILSEWSDMIRLADPDVVWIGLGTPKQDFVATELALRTGRTCVAVGAAFDFVAGTVSEAPRWIQGTGLEWIYRLKSDPRRLWRRYLFGNPRFLYSFIIQSRRKL